MLKISVGCFIGLTILFSCSLDAHAQDGRGMSSNRRANNAFEQALNAYHAYDYDRALDMVNRALRRDADFLQALILKAEVLFSMKRYEPSASAYLRVIHKNPNVYPQAHYYLGVSLFSFGDYAAAAQAFEAFPGTNESESPLWQKANQYLASCRFAVEAMANPVPFNPKNSGPAINTPDSEYSPAITADGQTLIFTRRSKRSNLPMLVHGAEEENFYVSHLQNGGWSNAENLGHPINTDGNEGAQSLSIDGREMYFTACNRPGGMGSCDIYYSQRTGEQWSTPINLGPVVNSASWDSQPSISADGKTLYFASARQGGYGDMDIWTTVLDSLGNWSHPVNLGPEINTNGREMSPFIHPDNITLYFASDGHPGMGGLDLFFSRKDEDGHWSQPKNLGYPLNTLADEFSLVTDASGRLAFYAADRPEGYGNMDIYAFELHADARPTPMTYMKGKVFDYYTQKPLAAAFELIDLESNRVIAASESDPVNGNFLVVVPLFVNLALSVSAPGYLFFSENFHYIDPRDVADPHLRDVPLQLVRAGESVVLRNVFFDTGHYQLKPESQSELDRLASLLTDNQSIHIEVGGHTDNTGDFPMNQMLSENRAKQVVEYLTGKGIEPDRISYKGYADTQPIDSNDTVSGRARNRRTTFTIIKP